MSQSLSRKQEVLVAMGVAALGLLLGLNLFLFFDDGEMFAHRDLAPGFELPVYDRDETLALNDLRGQIVLIDFWATWCAPCRVQMPALEAVHQPGDVAVLSVNTDEDSPERHELIANFFHDVGLSLPTVLDDGSVRALYRVGTIPTLVVVDRDGNINHIGAGIHDEEHLRALIDNAR